MVPTSQNQSRSVGRVEWTPGPWKIHQPWAGFSKITGPDGELIFGIAAGGRDEKQPDRVCDANALLIQAAPDLYAALKAITDQLERIGDLRPHKDGQFIEDARAALARADGE